MSVAELDDLLKKEYNEWDETPKVDNKELADIANICMMMWNKLEKPLTVRIGDLACWGGNECGLVSAVEGDKLVAFFDYRDVELSFKQIEKVIPREKLKDYWFEFLDVHNQKQSHIRSV